MKVKSKKTGAILLGILGMLTVGVVTYATTSEEPMTLTREEVGQLAVENSGVVRGQETALEDLAVAYSSYMDYVDILETLYDLLPRYESLYNKNVYTNSHSDYQAYYNLQVELATATAMGTTTAAINTSIAAIGLSEDEIDNIITVEESVEFGIYAEKFSEMSITEPLTDQEEYDIFINPIEVIPMEMMMGIQSMDVGIEVAEASISSAAISLYDGILAMEDGLVLITSSYEKAQETYNILQSKYEKGLVSSMALAQGENDYEIARLEKDKLERDLENLEMSLKQMIGLELTQPIILTDDLSYSDDIDTLDQYIEGALLNRSEILILEKSIVSKEKEFEAVEDLLSSSSNDYKIAEAELANLNLEMEQIQVEIELELRQAYEDVLNKKAEIDIAYRDYIDIQDDFASIEKYYELGLMPISSVNGYEILVLQKENAYKAAIRTYNSALRNLEGASNIGPSYN